MKTFVKFIFLVITGRLRPAFQIVRHLRLGTKVAFIGMGLISYVLHQYPRELMVLGERAYFAGILMSQPGNGGILLSPSRRQDLTKLIQTLQTDHALQSRDLGVDRDIGGWSTAQALVSLGKLQPVDAGAVREFYERTIDDECGCWREEKKRQPHTGATGWVIFAMSEYGLPAPARAMSYLLSAQSSEGWWGLHPAATDAKNASTYATAWATLGLCTQVPVQEKAGLSAEAGKTKGAVARALTWLAKNEIGQTARWYDYPANAPQMNSTSISGLILHVMRKCGEMSDLERLHRQWLTAMPASVDNAGVAEFSNMMLPLDNGVTEFDRTRNYVLQWTLIATVDAYANGSLLERAAVRQWLERIVRPGLASPEVRKQSWVSAELLYALRHLAEHLDQPLASLGRAEVSPP